MLAKKLIGEKCYLSPYEAEYAPLFYQWLNDMEVVRNLQLFGMSINLASETQAMGDLGKGHNYLIVDKASDSVIGGLGLMDIDQAHGTAELGIVIGDKGYWGKGYGTEAMRLLAAYGFDYLNLGNIMLKVYSYNARAIKAYEKVGFKRIGARRGALRLEGKRHDIVYMDMLPGELARA